MASASSSYRRPADLNNTNITTNEDAESTTNDNLATGGGGGVGDIKPRSLRFTWSMKTTSSMDPADMMKEIRKVRFFFLESFIQSCVCFCSGSRYE